jgi:hypothetical protein
MNKQENAKIASNGRVKKFIAENDAVLVLITLFAVIRDSFVDHMKALQKAVDKQAEDIKVWAQTKKDSKKKMADCIIKFAGRACLQADQLHMDEIMLALNKPITYISKANGTLALARARDLRQLMVDNITELTIITPADLTEMLGVITDYDDLVNMPKGEIEKKKAIGTSRIAAAQKDIDKDKADLGKLVHSFLPELVESYDNAVKVGLPTGVKKLRLEMHVSDAVGGSNLRNVSCLVTNGVKTFDTKTGKKGIARFYGLENGTWNVVAMKQYYAEFKQGDVSLSEEKIVKMEIKIRRNDVPDNTVGSFALTVYNMQTGLKLAGLIMRLPSIDKTYVSDAQGQLKGEGLAVGAYAAMISGEHVNERPISFMIEGNECTVGSFGMEVI